MGTFCGATSGTRNLFLYTAHPNDAQLEPGQARRYSMRSGTPAAAHLHHFYRTIPCLLPGRELDFTPIPRRCWNRWPNLLLEGGCCTWCCRSNCKQCRSGDSMALSDFPFSPCPNGDPSLCYLFSTSNTPLPRPPHHSSYHSCS